MPDEGLNQLGEDQLDDEQLERPSIGQLIAGVKQPSYMPRAAAPDTSAAPPPGVRPQLDPNAIPDAIRPPSMPAPNEIARPPVGVNSQRRLDLMAQESKLNKPTDPGAIDPKTGKPMYKLGTGSKILGTIANAFGAFGAAKTGQRYEPMDVGPGATNWKFGRAEELRKGQLAGVEQDLGEQEKLEGSQQKSYEDIVNEASKQQLGDARLAAAKAQQEKADILQQAENRKETTPPVNKTAETAAERTQVADRMGLKGEERKSYILTGKLPNEGRAPRTPSELETWISAFTRDNKRAPTADEIANRKANKPATRADFDKVQQRKTKALADAEKAYNKAVGQLTPNDAEGRQQALDELNTAKEAAQQSYLDEISTLNDRVPAGQTKANPQPTARPAAARPAAPARSAAPKVNDVVTVKGKKYTVGKVYPDGSWDPK